jgi:hypothetical protein
MTAALTPPLALDFLAALSADIRAVVILDHEGALRAGPESLATLAGELLEGDAQQLEGSTSEGAVYAARDAKHAIVVVTGRFALPRLTRHDLRAALSALGGESASDEPSAPVPAPLVEALVAAAAEHFRRPRAVSRSD